MRAKDPRSLPARAALTPVPDHRVWKEDQQARFLTECHGGEGAEVMMTVIVESGLRTSIMAAFVGTTLRLSRVSVVQGHEPAKRVHFCGWEYADYAAASDSTSSPSSKGVEKQTGEQAQGLNFSLDVVNATEGERGKHIYFKEQRVGSCRNCGAAHSTRERA
jgi:hypothetical protein